VSGVDEVVGKRARHVVVHLRVTDGRVEVVREEVAVEVVEREERAGEARDAGTALDDLLQQPLHLGLLLARGHQVASQIVGAHVGSPAGVDGEKGADVLGRRRVAGVEPALEDEAALVRGAHGVSGGAGGRAVVEAREGKGREGRRVKRDRQTATPRARERDCYTAAVPGPDEEEVSRYTLLLPSVYKNVVSAATYVRSTSCPRGGEKT
jgi:hypothetical protein